MGDGAGCLDALARHAASERDDWSTVGVEAVGIVESFSETRQLVDVIGSDQGQVQKVDVHGHAGGVDHVRRQGLGERNLRQLVVREVRLRADGSRAWALSVLRIRLVFVEVLAHGVVLGREVVIDLDFIVALIGNLRLVVDVVGGAAGEDVVGRRIEGFSRRPPSWC